MPSRSRSRSLALLVLVLTLVASAWAQDPKPVTGVKVAAPLKGTAVTDSSILLIDQANYLTVAGFKVAVDGGTPFDVGMVLQTDLGGGAGAFRVPVSSLALTNGSHALTFYSYIYAVNGTVTSTATTFNVVKS